MDKLLNVNINIIPFQIFFCILFIICIKDSVHKSKSLQSISDISEEFVYLCQTKMYHQILVEYIKLVYSMLFHEYLQYTSHGISVAIFFDVIDVLVLFNIQAKIFIQYLNYIRVSFNTIYIIIFYKILQFLQK